MERLELRSNSGRVPRSNTPIPKVPKNNEVKRVPLFKSRTYSSGDVQVSYKASRRDDKSIIMIGNKTLLSIKVLHEIATFEGQSLTEFYMPGMSYEDEGFYECTNAFPGQYGTSKTHNLKSESTLRIEGEVISIQSGDTISVQFDDQVFVVKLFGVVAPSLNELYFGQASLGYLRSLCGNEKVTVFFRNQNDNQQLLGVVKLEGNSINEAMIRDGYSQADKRKGQIMENHFAIQKEAKASSSGLWANGWREY